MVKKVCVVTGSRAEYGLLRWVIDGIRDSRTLELQLVVTGTHLSQDFGLTVREIERDGLSIDYQVEMLLASDTSVGVAKSLGLGVIGFADALARLKPDMVLLLGDRYEILSAATAAMIARVPIAHVHGGESTEGLIDDAIRHAITKMSQLHFVAAEPYRDRVIQMGEHPNRVHNVGGLGVESVRRSRLMDGEQLEKELGITLFSPTFLVTYHPVTLCPEASASDFSELLEALRRLEDAQVLFTMPNSDTEGRGLAQMVRAFCSEHVNAHFFESLGQAAYLSLMAQVNGVVGNSSSGLLEAPALRVGSVNIGSRQNGRLLAPSVISVEGDRNEIHSALKTVASSDFISGLGQFENPYGVGHASERIIQILEELDPAEMLHKAFWNGATS